VRVDYEKHGRTYTRFRQPDPRIAERIRRALGDARTVVNVGAGAGSYEPRDRWVLAVEPSATMRAQRPVDAAPAIAARAEALPLDDDAVDAAMACVTIHQWEPPEAGLAEMRRVARSRVVLFTFDLDHLPAWQQDYLADALAIERPRFPSLETIAQALGGRVWVEHVPTPGNVSTDSSKRSGDAPRRCSTRRYVPRSRSGLCSSPVSSSASSTGSARTLRPERGTPSTGACAT
jgi:SAM-dependent methyltransferase